MKLKAALRDDLSYEASSKQHILVVLIIFTLASKCVNMQRCQRDLLPNKVESHQDIRLNCLLSGLIPQ